jgi:PAS domain S-box-containing protein
MAITEVERTIKAIRNENIDALVGKNGDYLLRLRKIKGALQASEQKFRTAFANAAIGFAMTTPDGCFVDANHAFSRLTGYCLRELKTLKFPQLIHPDDLDHNMRLIDRMLAGQIADFVVENRYLSKGGKTVWVRKSVSLVRSAEGTPQWIIGLIEDVTERKQAEEGLCRAMAASEALNRELEQPFAHAEMVSLKTFCNKKGILLHQAMAELRGEPASNFE